MNAWWNDLAPRERVLIGTAAVLTVLFILWQFILVPTFTAQDRARAELTQARTVLTRVQEAYGRQRASPEDLSANLAATSTDALKTEITRAASDKGLAIARLQTGEDGSISLLFDSADPRIFFFWLEEVETRLGGRVARLTMEQAGGGNIRANIEFEGTRPQ
ncbi:MAG: type II secretion system protein GspM [Henriciella sp.]|nr:type II secretion system protein GspM [Henriciella sp.]